MALNLANLCGENHESLQKSILSASPLFSMRENDFMQNFRNQTETYEINRKALEEINKKIAQEGKRHRDVLDAGAKANIKLLDETKAQNEILCNQLIELKAQKKLLEGQLTEQKTINEELREEFRKSAWEAAKARKQANISIWISVISLLFAIVFSLVEILG